MTDRPHGPVFGEHAVDVPITCSLTRFGLRGARFLMPSYLQHRRLRREAEVASPDGLLRSAFLVENPTTWFSLSIWAGEPLMSANMPSHVDAAREAFGHLAYSADRGPELWSTQWKLVSVSNNLNWGDFDLSSLLVGAQG